MENGLLYILAFSAMAIALFAVVLPQALFENLPQESTYTLNQDGAYYWVIRNDGAKMYESTNCSYTLTSAMDSIPEGGRITVSAYDGYYYLTKSVVSESKAILLEGESLSYQNGYGQTCIFIATTFMDYMFNFSGQWTSIEKLTLDGNNTKSGGIKLGGIDNSVNNCFIMRFDNASTAGIYLYSTNHWVTNNWIEFNAVGIVSSSNTLINNNHFVENTQDVTVTSYNVKIHNNLFRNPSSRALNLWSACSDTIITANVFEAVQSINEFVIMSQTINNTIIGDNVIKGNAASQYFIRLYTNTVINGVQIHDNNVRTLGTGLIQYGAGLTGNVTAYNNMIDDVLVP